MAPCPERLLTRMLRQREEEVLPALLWRFALCSPGPGPPGPPHPANPQCSGRIRRPTSDCPVRPAPPPPTSTTPPRRCPSPSCSARSACQAPHRPGRPGAGAFRCSHDSPCRVRVSPFSPNPAPLRRNSGAAQCFESTKPPPEFASAAPPGRFLLDRLLMRDTTLIWTLHLCHLLGALSIEEITTISVYNELNMLTSASVE